MALPKEIIGNIFQYLSINDIEVFIQSALVYSRTVKCISTRSACMNELGIRISPERYLNKHFGNGKFLLESMFNCGCIITGSRALELFNPGSVSDNSDWNFFVAPGRRNIVFMAKILEQLGVVWETPIQTLYRLASNIGYDNDYIHRWLNERIEESLNIGIRVSMDEAIEGCMKDLTELETDNFSILENTRTLKGVIKYRESNASISLTYSIVNENALELVKRMSHSAIQCFITNIGIGHLYYSFICRNVTHIWLSSYYSDSHQKYENRGYTTINPTYTNKNNEWIARSLSDLNAKFIVTRKEGKYFSIVKRILSACWYQHSNWETSGKYSHYIMHYDSPHETVFRTNNILIEDDTHSYLLTEDRYRQFIEDSSRESYIALQDKYGVRHLEIFPQTISPIYI